MSVKFVVFQEILSQLSARILVHIGYFKEGDIVSADNCYCSSEVNSAQIVVPEGFLSVMYWVLVLLEHCCFIIIEVVIVDTVQMVNSTQVMSHSQLLNVPWEIHGWNPVGHTVSSEILIMVDGDEKALISSKQTAQIEFHSAHILASTETVHHHFDVSLGCQGWELFSPLTSHVSELWESKVASGGFAPSLDFSAVSGTLCVSLSGALMEQGLQIATRAAPAM
jgi:hypothetical protein